jgi:hypothetical protein
MSPVNEPQLSFKGGSGGSRLLGLRESNQALAELKAKLESALSKLNDQDTHRFNDTVDEIREFLQTLYPDWFPMVISCIGEAGTNLKPLGRCESVKLLGLLAELHGEAVVPLLARILQVVVTRLQDADLHLREACAETVYRLARALVIDVENAQVFGTLLKPLFGALGEHSKWVQIGAAACICSVIQGSPPPVVRDNLGRLCSRLVQHLSLPLAMAKPQLLGACIYAMDAVKGIDFDEVLPSLMPCLESCLNATSDWQTRKQAIEVLQTIGDNPELGQSLDLPPPPNAVGPTPLQRRIALLLEVVRTDKVRAVREAVKDVMLRWAITKAPGLPTGMVRSSSPTSAADLREGQQRQGSAGTARSSSPLGSAWMDRDQARGFAEGSSIQMPPTSAVSMGGNAGVRQNRSVRASTRERDDEVTVLVPPDRSRGATEAVPGSADKSDAASEKARAIKQALSGAALNSTKKPRPKRERQSIFSGPANKNFFKPAPAGQAAPSGAAGSVEDGGEDLDGGIEEGQEQDEDTLRGSYFQEDEEPSREMRAAQFHTKQSSPRHDRATNGSTVAASSGGRGDTWPDSREESVGDIAEYRQPSEDESPDSARQVPAVAASEATAAASPARRMPVGGKSPDRSAASIIESGDIEELAQRLRALEEDKGEREERFLNAIQTLENTCEGQIEALAEQSKQLELMERRLQSQEQQCRLQEQRVQQQEQQLLQQEKRLHDQELQIQQLGEQCDENTQLLREHEHQMEQQEQLLDQHKALVNDLLSKSASVSQITSEDQAAQVQQAVRTAPPLIASPVDSISRPPLETWAHSSPPASQPAATPPAMPPLALGGEADRPKVSSTSSFADLIGEQQRPVTAASLRESLLQADAGGSMGQTSTKGSQGNKVASPLWDKVLELCDEQRFLEAYKQVIAEPEETCLLRLMQHTGPIVEQLDAESNSRLIRRLIHILSSPKEPAHSCIEQVFAWLWQALDVGIHFTSSQVEDLAAALQKASAPNSFRDRREAQQLLARVIALRRT